MINKVEVCIPPLPLRPDRPRQAIYYSLHTRAAKDMFFRWCKAADLEPLLACTTGNLRLRTLLNPQTPYLPQ